MSIYKFGHYALQAWKIPDLVGRILPADTLVQPSYIVFGPAKGSIDKASKITIHESKIKRAEYYTTPSGLCLPELAYMQVANEHNLVELIYIGLQLVSGYQGKAPITTVQALYECAISLHGYHGRPAVLKAIPYLREGSRSPMETLTYMKLCLPVSLGGRGFRDFVFNYPIRSEKYNRNFYADLCWPEKKIIIEYQGSHHHQEKFKAKDEVRRLILESEGYQIIEVWAEDLHDKERFEEIVLAVQAASEKRVRYRTGKFIENYTRIRDILFSYGHQRNKRQSSFVKIARSELSAKPWISRVYELYLIYHRRFISRFKMKFFYLHPRSRSGA